MMTITAHYEQGVTVMNVLDDLINHGIDRDKVFTDERNREVKVIIPDAIEDEVSDILNRHHPI